MAAPRAGRALLVLVDRLPGVLASDDVAGRRLVADGGVGEAHPLAVDHALEPHRL